MMIWFDGNKIPECFRKKTRNILFFLMMVVTNYCRRFLHSRTNDSIFSEKKTSTVHSCAAFSPLTSQFCHLTNIEEIFIDMNPWHFETNCFLARGYCTSHTDQRSDEYRYRTRDVCRPRALLHVLKCYAWSITTRRDHTFVNGYNLQYVLSYINEYIMSNMGFSSTTQCASVCVSTCGI